jgi:pyridoxal phosphate enzyme (YggS family)
VACGQVDFGENYAQELRDKSAVVAGAVWHFIGPLQENKVNMIVGRAASIHTICREKILLAVERRAASLGIVQDVLVQVNTGAEPQKNGLAPAELGAFLRLFAGTPHVRCRGLMTLPPFDLDPEAVRPHFVELARLLGEARAQRLGNVELVELSMGMSGDFEVAIAEGATCVRVGSALFGPRLPGTGVT